MCGLLAASGKIKPEIISALGCLNSSRGRDSAGIAWSDSGKIKLKKRAADPMVVFNVDLKGEIDVAAKAGNVIGHTRQATHGDKTSENAHPFFMKGVAFAHNGVIHNYLEFGQYEVDSQALIHGILDENFSAYTGNIALVWIQDGKLHAFRSGNPLHRGVKAGALYLSSEEAHLKAVGCEKVRELSAGSIYVIDKGLIVGSKRVPVNAGYTSVSYSSPGYRPNCRRWINGKWESETPEPTKPEPSAICKCTHAGSFHTHVNAQTQNWACYTKPDGGSAYCPCNDWTVDKPAPVPAKTELVVAKRFRSICACGHGLLRHSMRGVFQSCDAHRCACTNYRQIEMPEPENAPPIPQSELWNVGIENMSPKTMCECDHELEYHITGGLHCHVSMCECKWFWPKAFEENDAEVLESNFR